jgi:hypothetical protein
MRFSTRDVDVSLDKRCENGHSFRVSRFTMAQNNRELVSYADEEETESFTAQ